MGNLDEGIQVRQTSRRDAALLSTIEPKNINEAYEDLHWNKAMQEEIEQIERSGTWELVSRPKDKNFIGTKWILKPVLQKGMVKFLFWMVKK